MEQPNVIEQLVEAIAPYQTWVFAGGAVVLGLVLLRIALNILGRKPQAVDPERHLREDLAGFPPAPGAPGSRQLLIQGVPARLRLVVLAPAGRQNFVDPDAATDILDQVAYGLGTVAQIDKPRVCVWPPQLSHSGFAPTFFRLVTRPEPDGRPSPWILIAGPVRARGGPVLLGLACYAEKPTTAGRLTMEENQWPSVMRLA
jgi:hypothetical protein